MASAQHVGVALSLGHAAPRHEADASGVEQSGDVPVVGEGLGGVVDAAARAVPQADLIAHQPLVAEAGCRLLHVAGTAQTGDAVIRHTQVEAGADGRIDGVERIGHDDAGDERSGQDGEERFAQGGQVGVAERRLELAHAEAGGVAEAIVHPGLLQDVAAAAGRVHRDVVVEAAERGAGEADDGVGDGEAGIGHIVLIVGLVQTFVVIVVEHAARLQEEVGLEDEFAVLRLQREASVVGDAGDAVLHVDGGRLVLQLPHLGVELVVLDALFTLGKREGRKAEAERRKNSLFHCLCCFVLFVGILI